MGIAKVTRNYQVTIPKDVRTIQEIHIGDTVLFAFEGNKVDFMKLKNEQVLKSAIGMLKTKESGIEYSKRMRADWKRREERFKL